MNPYIGFGIIFLFFGGLWIDGKCHTGYLWAFIGLALGIAQLGYEIWKMSRRK